MKTLAELAEHPDDVQRAPHGAVFSIRCARPDCDKTIKAPRYAVLNRIRLGTLNAYCCRGCKGQHTLEQAITTHDGIQGRVCTACGEWTPMNKMTRGCLCGKCKRKPPKTKFATSQAQALARGSTWSLSYEEAMKFWNQPCYYCGDPIEGLRLDQISPQGGYKIGNVVSCCWACNRGKGNGTQGEFIARCHRVASLDAGSTE